MEEFLEESATIQRLVYKAKNAHHSTLYFRKLVHVKRLSCTLAEALKKNKPASHILSMLQDQCMSAYISLSSLVAIGHHVAFAIASMAAVAKVYSLSRLLALAAERDVQKYGKGVIVDIPSKESPTEENSNEESPSEEISDIFNKL
ncbi:hypothetical protein NECID01_0259 [Nematocida sp. AWRm77]|nr:hypothetical protein NECID01_0259 [Nematocida sp. AWRm77]